MKNKLFITILHWLVIITIPFFLTVLTMRLLIAWDSPGYPAFEYRRIPSDAYGFSDRERLAFAEATLAYLRRPEPADEVIYILEDLRLPQTNQPLYNQEEIGHMLDVKTLADAFKRLMWVLAIVAVGGLIFLLIQPEARQVGYRTMMRGGVLTAGILVVVGMLIGVAWNFVFVQFHELLFPPGTWTFAYTDSLIRLFPEKFWFDFGVIWVGGILVQGIILTIAGYLLLRQSS